MLFTSSGLARLFPAHLPPREVAGDICERVAGRLRILLTNVTLSPPFCLGEVATEFKTPSELRNCILASPPRFDGPRVGGDPRFPRHDTRTLSATIFRCVCYSCSSCEGGGTAVRRTGWVSVFLEGVQSSPKARAGQVPSSRGSSGSSPGPFRSGGRGSSPRQRWHPAAALRSGSGL